MEEIIEKWANCYIRYRCKTENDAQETNEDLLNLLRMIEKQEGIAAMEKQPTEYEYEKVDLSSNDIALSMIGGEVLYDHDGTYKYSWNGSRFVNQEGNPIVIRGFFYRRVELTPEQLHERKVEELKDVINNAMSRCQYRRDEPLAAAKAALEWMESKGK